MFRRHGITMIELVITLAIVAVLTVMVVPNLGRWIQHYRIRGAVREIVSQMELAKIKALKNNREYRVAFDKEDGNTWKFQLQNRPDPWSDWEPEGGKFSLPTQVSIDEDAFPNPAVQFKPEGTAPGWSVILETRHGERHKISVTSATGKINTKRVY